MGDCGVAWFICVEIEDALYVSNVLFPCAPPYKKSNLVLSKTKTKASVQSFCSTLKSSIQLALCVFSAAINCFAEVFMSPPEACMWSLSGC